MISFNELFEYFFQHGANHKNILCIPLQYSMHSNTSFSMILMSTWQAFFLSMLHDLMHVSRTHHLLERTLELCLSPVSSTQERSGKIVLFYHLYKDASQICQPFVVASPSSSGHHVNVRLLANQTHSYHRHHN